MIERVNGERSGDFNLWHDCIGQETRDLLSEYNKRYFHEAIDPPLPTTVRLESIEDIASEMQKAPAISNHMRAE